MAKGHTHSGKTPENLWFAIMCVLFAPVAQLDRVLVSEAKGRGFDSRRARQENIVVILN